MNDKKKDGRYLRIYKQLEELLQNTEDPIARMATVCAVLHHKMQQYFWTGFYLLHGNKLIVGPYQDTVACQELENNRGVCWATINSAAPIVVSDVSDFPDHIACDSRSKSEIVIPVFDQEQKIKAVIDVDSDQLNSFDEVVRVHLQKITGLIYKDFGH